MIRFEDLGLRGLSKIELSGDLHERVVPHCFSQLCIYIVGYIYYVGVRGVGARRIGAFYG